MELSSTADQDWAVFGKVVQGYESVASEKKNEATAHENSLPRLGNGSKKDKGRLFDFKEWKGKQAWVADLVEKNGIKPMLDKLGGADRRQELESMCMKVLEDNGGALLGKRKNEDHLYPEEHRKEIDQVVEALEGANVTAKDLEMFSCALHVLDSLTTACLRPQDSLGFRACEAYVKNGSLEFVFPEVCKNSSTLVRSARGMVVKHTKSERTRGEFVGV